MVLITERLSERMRVRGMSQAELARQIGISQQAVGKLVSGASRRTSHISNIARALQTTSGYLEGVTDDPTEGAVPVPTERDIAEHLDLVPIVEIDQDYGMGGSFTAGYVEQQIHHFPRTWVESITSSPPALLTIARGKGDSMDPTIRDRDMIIIDRSRRMIDEADAIWALTVGDIGMVKRLRIRGAQVVIKSDNDRVDDEIVHHEEVNIVGRVVFIGRRT